jgi:asparagine synthetase B (glutamine-hydrolysing)
MIGVFGLYRAEPAAPADPGPLAATVSDCYAVEAPAGTGAALGRVGHRLDLCGGRAVSQDGRWQAVACGEIFNLAEFAEHGRGAAHAADLILRLAQAGELDRLTDVNGQFCAALYDRPNHRLFLITDRLATHAIHLWRQGNEVVFATHLYMLIGDPRVPRRADSGAVAQLFTMQRTIGRTTPLAGVEALPAACIYEINRMGIRERCYWSLKWRQPDFSLDEGSVLLAEAMRKTVARQTGERRVGLLLSGGVDSRMVLAAAGEAKLSCWTTASYADNPELALAQEIAGVLRAEHHAVIVPPESTLDVLDETVIASGGLYPASTPVSAFMPVVGKACPIVLTGHGLDYTLRGYYLPARFIEFAGSRTRLPALRAIPRRPSGSYVLENLRQGPPRDTIARIVRRERQGQWWDGQAKVMEEVLAPWLQGDEPYNAWDAFILHAVSKHYAFTSMAAVRAAVDLRMPAFDNEVFDVYLRMPPAWRCNGRLVQMALRRLGPLVATIPNANTGFRADLHPWLEVGALLGRGALRRIGVLQRDALPSPSHSHGSWQNVAELYRRDPGHRERLLAIRGRLDSLTLGLMDADALARCIDEHLEGTMSHTKLLRQLYTHDAWVRTFRIEGHA